MKVVLAAEAVGDLERIGDWIARDDPDRARSFVTELLEMTGELAEFSERFPLVPRYAEQGIRRRVHRNHLIIYRVEAERVVVIHVIHGARDYEALLFPEE